jgi:methylmalonyl-CoA carboxyltransferase large subunit
VTGIDNGTGSTMDGSTAQVAATIRGQVQVQGRGRGSTTTAPDADTTAAGPTMAELLARIEELTRRVEWLEATRTDGPRAPTAVPPDVVLAISAAVAAYLGKRATVRQVHLRSHSTWAKQGRAQVMASHGFVHGTR